ncbi:hypothetical protein HK096_008846, partial [Nowakowskiella sp. JEL0078]
MNSLWRLFGWANLEEPGEGSNRTRSGNNLPESLSSPPVNPTSPRFASDSPPLSFKRLRVSSPTSPWSSDNEDDNLDVNLFFASKTTSPATFISTSTVSLKDTSSSLIQPVHHSTTPTSTTLVFQSLPPPTTTSQSNSPSKTQQPQKSFNLDSWSLPPPQSPHPLFTRTLPITPKMCLYPSEQAVLSRIDKYALDISSQPSSSEFALSGSFQSAPEHDRSHCNDKLHHVLKVCKVPRSESLFPTPVTREKMEASVSGYKNWCHGSSLPRKRKRLSDDGWARGLVRVPLKHEGGSLGER